MYIITIHDAASKATRFRMPELCLAPIAGMRFEGRVNAGYVAARINGDTSVSFKDADWGARAWSPPA